MSQQKNKAEYTMALVILSCGVLLSTIIFVSASFDGEYGVMTGSSTAAFIFTVIFQKVYRKLNAVERSDLRGKDDDWENDEGC